jgi:hypothetical protein
VIAAAALGSTGDATRSRPYLPGLNDRRITETNRFSSPRRLDGLSVGCVATVTI